MKALAVLAAAMLLFSICAGALAASYGGSPSIMWRDEERAARRGVTSATGVETNQSRARVQALPGIPLPQSAVSERTTSVRGGLASNPRINAHGGTLQTAPGPDDWRIKIREAAVTTGPMVTLAEIADPLGPISAEDWRALAATPLWPAPEEGGKPFQINKTRVTQALKTVLGEAIADHCIVPNSLTMQKGGLVLREEDLRSYVVRTLTPQLAAMPGEAGLQDLRLPPYIFLAHPQQIVELEPVKLVPGRLNMRFVIREANGQVLKRVSGSATLDMWINVPATARPLNKGDHISAENVTFIRMNAAGMREMPWDGRGGPWQVLRSIGAGQPIFQGDLAAQAMVRKGTVVSMQYSVGNVHIRTQAEALTDGAPGATIPVRNLQSKKQIYATVVDGNTVVVK